jgi:protein O-GlcNAc transferase
VQGFSSAVESGSPSRPSLMSIPSSFHEAVQMAASHQRAGRFAEAETIYRQVLAEQPGHREALHLLGILAAQTGRPEVAVDLIGRITALNPGDAAAWSDLGNALEASGRTGEAVAAQRHALALGPDSSQTWNNLGRALHADGGVEEALAAFRRALEIEPNFAEAQSNLGHALLASRQRDAAVAAYRRAIELQPGCAQFHYNLGFAYQTDRRFEEAVGAYREALRLDPRLAEACNNLAVCLKTQGRLSLAAEAYQKAMALAPGNPSYHSNLIYLLNFHPEYGTQALYEESRRWAVRHAGESVRREREHRNDPAPERRLRIGYVSPDFRKHVVGYNMLPALRERDHGRFEVFCYSSVAQADELTEKIRAYADVWREIAGMGDERVAEMIREDGIDILVDLTMHMAGSRLLVFARQPAPVQASYLASCSTSGLEEIGYRISDPFITPEGADLTCYSERVVRLAHSAWCYEPSGPMPEVGPLPALASGRVTFASRNNPGKVSESVLELWAEILAAVPDSRLLLSAPPGSARTAIGERFRAKGLSAERVEYLWQEPWAEFIQSYGRIDVALDPFPYNGWITSCDALWMGVPVVTLCGETPLSRGGCSILSNIGLPELVAQTREQYVEIAVSLAQDWPRLKAMRASLRERMERSPLRDAKNHTRELEAAYRQMWRQWCNRASTK